MMGRPGRQGGAIEPIVPQRTGDAMYHTIEFSAEFIADLEISPKHWLERVLIRPGDRMLAQIRPHVVETDDGPVEMADLFFADGTATRGVPFETFTFLT